MSEKTAKTDIKVEAKKISTEIVLQYRGYEADIKDIEQRIKDQYVAKGYDVSSIETLQVYVKPEDFTAYYVVNEDFVGKVPLFESH